MYNVEKNISTLSEGSELTVDISRWDNEGRGIADLPGGKICFVEGAVPGETVNIRISLNKKNYAEAVLTSVITPSPHRVTRTSGCEGARLDHVDYDGQTEFKFNKVRDCLIRIGGVPEDVADRVMRPVITADRLYNYRNHMQYRIKGGRICEVKRNSNDLVPVTVSDIEYEIFGKVRSALEQILDNAPTELFSGVVLRASERTHELLVELVSRDARTHELVIRDTSVYVEACKVASKITEAASGYRLRGILLRISPDKVSSRTRSGKRVVLTGDDFYEEKMCGRTFRVKAGAFFQVNTEQAEKLYRAASEGIGETDVIYDVYCGTGTIGLSCTGDKNTLIGIESVREAVDSARINASISGVDNARFICRPAEKVDPAKDRLPHPDVVIVDPPRKGMDPVFVRRLLELKPPRITYISCDPATMARDLKMLTRDYDILSVTPADLFCRTEHVETVVQLTKK